MQDVLKLVDRSQFPQLQHAARHAVQLCTLTPKSCREVMAECGWISAQYESAREENIGFPPDRQQLIYSLYKKSGEQYTENTGNAFPGYHLRNLMKFGRNYALITGRLMPDLYQILSAAKGCVDHNYAYEVWELATEYPFLRNIDGLQELDLSIEDIWKNSKLLKFHLKQRSRKEGHGYKKRPDKSKFRFKPPGIFSICSYPVEDKIVESFGNFLKKKGAQILTEESSKTIPFSTSLEDGVDIRETVRHWYEKALYVKVKGKPPGDVGSVVVIFDEDTSDEEVRKAEKYFWKTTWIGEHQQESDMAFYATPLGHNVVGPGISRCEYGGFMMTYPPRRLTDVWSDPDYQDCRTKSEVLLMSAIDYSIVPVVVYVASKPPRAALKNFAQRFGKKVVYIPMGQLSPVTMNKIRVFHVLDGYDKRAVADEYIY
jgi:hypothetical protein